MEPYRSFFPHARLLVPETQRLAGRVLVLPTGSAITPEAIAVVGGVIRRATSEAGRIRERLAQVEVEADVSFSATSQAPAG